MNHKFIVLVVFSLLIILLVAAVNAANVRTVTADTFWDVNASGTTVNGSSSIVDAQGSESSCNRVRVGLLQWDVSDIPTSETVEHVKVTLHTIRSSTGTDSNTKLALFAAPDNWDESTQQSDLPTPPSDGDTPLMEVSGPYAVNGDVVFDAQGSSDALVSYVQNQVAGDRTVSFWVKITSGCPSGGSARVAWNSRESGTSYLELYDANAVTISRFSSNNNYTWPVIAGIVALALAAVAGIGYGARRFNS